MSEAACGQGRGVTLGAAVSVLTVARRVGEVGVVSTTGGGTAAGGLGERTERIPAVTARMRTRMSGVAFCMWRGWLTASGFGNAEKAPDQCGLIADF